MVAMRYRKKARFGKYNAKKTYNDGIRFDSAMEARRYSELKLLVKAKEIEELEIQKRYPLHVDATKIGSYVADFVYRFNGEQIVEDVKGMKTPLYKWKKKHFEAEYGMPITEVTA